MFISVLLLGLPLYAFTGQYKGLTRYVVSRALYKPCRPQWTVGVAVGWPWRDVASADAALQQLDPALVAAHRLHRIGTFCPA